MLQDFRQPMMSGGLTYSQGALRVLSCLTAVLSNWLSSTAQGFFDGSGRFLHRAAALVQVVGD